MNSPSPLRRRLPAVVAFLLAATALALLPVQAASAHPAGTTGVLVTVQSDAVDVRMQIQKAGFVAATGLDPTSQSELDAVSDNLMTFILHRVTVHDQVSALTPEVTERPVLETVNDEDAVVTTVRFADAGRAVEGAVVLDYDFILDVVPGHQVYVSLVSDWNDGQVAEGDPRAIGVLGGGVTEVTLDRASVSPTSGFLAVIWLGMLHIAEGTDHLLFLATLLIVAPSLAVRAHRGLRWRQPIALRKTVGRAALIITAFTAGHLVTLALVSLGLVSFPSKPVEILVAISIVVAAAHALKPLLPRGEILIAGGFGLVHGTAFATTILDLNLGFGEKLMAILGFNIGVELAQLIAALLVLPLLVWLSHARAFAGFRVGVAVLAIIAAFAWIAGILTDQESVLQPLFDGVAQAPVLFYGALVALVAVLWWTTRLPRSTAATGDEELAEKRTGESVTTGPDERVPTT